MIRFWIRLPILLIVLASIGQSQIKVTRSDKLALPRTHSWSHPQFSPTGAAVYLPIVDGNEYGSIPSRAARQSRLLRTQNRDCPSAFPLTGRASPTAGRSRTNQSSGGEQDIVLTNLAKGTNSILASGSDVSIPTFSKNTRYIQFELKPVGLAKMRDQTT